MNMRVPPDHELPDREYYLRRKLIEARRDIMILAGVAIINGSIALILATKILMARYGW